MGIITASNPHEHRCGRYFCSQLETHAKNNEKAAGGRIERGDDRKHEIEALTAPLCSGL